MQGWYTIRKSDNIMYVSGLKKKNCMIIPVDREKCIWQNSTAICDKSSEKENRELPLYDWENLIANIIMNAKRLNVFPKIGNKARVSTLASIIQHHDASFSQYNQAREETQDPCIGK